MRPTLDTDTWRRTGLPAEPVLDIKGHAIAAEAATEVGQEDDYDPELAATVWRFYAAIVLTLACAAIVIFWS